ncbi:DNA polymerase beta superfamily protein, partial [Salmonella sp. M265]|uniref:DNA polymerase beta superfamily protein n=1 Tax=Salmonella sp. M265 TaxID=3240301 RepID=UPI00352A4C75
YRGYLKGDSVRLKKYLYVLRPLFAVSWLDAGLGLPPVAFERLVEATLDDPSLREELDALLSLKRQRDESAYGPPRLAL